MAEQVLRTLMRTTDIVIAGLLSPAAIAAVGLADLYARISLQIGLGIGDGAITLSSQDTGSEATANRDEAVAQALLLGGALGLPLSVFGLVFSAEAIAIMGAEADVVRIGAAYLTIVMIAAPASILTLVGARAIQGTGDTYTAMLVNAFANVLNIVGSVALAFGLGPLPELSMVGVAVASALADVVAASLFLGVIYRPRSPFTLVVPTQLILTKQLVVISVPRIGEGCSEIVAEFPFNAILLVFGTEVNAAYHIGRRMYHQIASPLSRGYSVAANILVGQALGREDPRQAYADGVATILLAIGTIGVAGIGLYVGAEQFVRIFSTDPVTVDHAVQFTQIYAITAFLIAATVVTSGSLRGGSDTVTPFLARLTGTGVFLLGIAYVGGVRLEYGVTAVYVAIVADYVWRTCLVGTVFYRRRWIDRARTLMIERGSVTDTNADKED
ncbi:MATE family efflux transporter [Halostagnicola sp. A-GB9-2]|uniref:MATE family efflux transporter n=1 Tax=Halostagnicola sp. A-GB9-2 TaxID=3048066 RepID=UPI0024BF3BD7|nr:MATE family efflux transporter [Halostagnicola sp. A-GB9-2]MDJ1433824.1 MATE family efflux transporter [Halostagnicola sp. A-GB9-2]